MYFTITTNKETAEAIKAQCDFDNRLGNYRSYHLGEILHEPGYSVVQIKANQPDGIKPEDLFWLGHHSASYKTQTTNGHTH